MLVVAAADDDEENGQFSASKSILNKTSTIDSDNVANNVNINDFYQNNIVGANRGSVYSTPIWITGIELPPIAQHGEIESVIVKQFYLEWKEMLDANNNINNGSIVYSAFCQSFHGTCKRLHDKYIVASQAPLEINISYRIRRKIGQLFSNDPMMIENLSDEMETMSDLKEFVTFVERYLRLFQEANTEIVTLLRDSFTRFAKTAIGENLIEEYT